MKPPTRKRTSCKPFQTDEGRKWTLKDKENLIKAIKIYGTDNYTQLQTYVPKHSVKEVEDFIVKRQKSCTDRVCRTEDLCRVKTPIEEWILLVQDLLLRGDDLSSLVGNVEEVCASLEPHSAPRNDEEPDYGHIYAYLAAILQGKELPKLTKLEAGIVLELFQHLADRLKAMDLKDQRRLMQLKHALLSRPTDMVDPSITRRLIATALKEDPLEMERKLLAEKNASQKQTPEQPSTSSQVASSSTDTEAMPSSISAPKPGPSGRMDTPGDHSSKATPAAASKEDPRPKMTPLLSLNPLCIPVKYLNPRPKHRLQPTWPQPEPHYRKVPLPREFASDECNPCPPSTSVTVVSEPEGDIVKVLGPVRVVQEREGDLFHGTLTVNASSLDTQDQTYTSSVIPDEVNARLDPQNDTYTSVTDDHVSETEEPQNEINTSSVVTIDQKESEPMHLVVSPKEVPQVRPVLDEESMKPADGGSSSTAITLPVLLDDSQHRQWNITVDHGCGATPEESKPVDSENTSVQAGGPPSGEIDYPQDASDGDGGCEMEIRQESPGGSHHTVTIILPQKYVEEKGASD